MTYYNIHIIDVLDYWLLYSICLKMSIYSITLAALELIHDNMINISSLKENIQNNCQNSCGFLEMALADELLTFI